MGKKEDELEIAKFAAFAAGALKQVDSSKINHGTGGPANKLDPRSFISKPIPQQPQKKIAIPGLVEEPKSRPLGAEPAGTVAVNVNDLLIPAEGLDEETAEAMKKHMSNSDIPTPPQQGIQPSSSAVPGTEAKTIVTETKQVDEKSELEKSINYLKRKIRAIEKNQDKIIKMLGDLNFK